MVLINFFLVTTFSKKSRLYELKLLHIFFVFFLEVGMLLKQKVKGFLDRVKIFGHLMMMASTLVRVASLDKLGKGLENLPLAAWLLLTKFGTKFFQEGVIFGILFFLPVPCSVDKFIFFLVLPMEVNLCGIFVPLVAKIERNLLLVGWIKHVIHKLLLLIYEVKGQLYSPHHVFFRNDISKVTLQAMTYVQLIKNRHFSKFVNI